MSRSELIAVLAVRFPTLTETEVDESVKLILETIASRLASGGRVEIRGFGSFDLSYRRAWNARNPKSGAKVEVPGRFVPRFRPGKGLREGVDRLPAQKMRCAA
ncbi:MAG: HU family DNA-binding protein [Sterolibacterium sp.]